MTALAIALVIIGAVIVSAVIVAWCHAVAALCLAPEWEE